MIVREMANGQLLCIHQTTHALMAEQFCRHWGNADFARPLPYVATMLAITQHDNGWYEWELHPRLRSDGYPMDFMHDDDPFGKLDLWRLGIDRVFAQHPYAALLVGKHAALLYAGDLPNLPDDLAEQVNEFIADQQMLINVVRHAYADDARYQAWLTDQALEANTRLLQLGDRASLQVLVPWSMHHHFPSCPLNAQERIGIDMAYDAQQITFSPWPFQVDAFVVEIHGKLLSSRCFADQEAYQSALAEAPLVRLDWQVVKE
ncbi:MAG: DUF3891 family protein [Caldilineaceae bacterium]|nr:DUF3891 family protein [Caldilineaceae bacterium]